MRISPATYYMIMSYKILNISKFSNSHAIFYISHASFGGLNYRSSSSSITSGFNPDTLLSSFSGEYNSPLSSSFLFVHFTSCLSKIEARQFVPLRKSQILNLQSKIRRQPPKVHLSSIIYAVYRTWFIYHLLSIIYHLCL